MKNRKENKQEDIKNLNLEMQLVQMENFTNDFDKAVKKELKKDLKNLAIILVPASLLICGFFIFNSTLLLISGIGIIGTASIIEITKEFINNIKKLDNTAYNNNSSQNNSKEDKVEEKTIEQILEEGIGKSEDKDFYTEDTKDAIDRIENESESEKKYREALKKQEEQLEKFNSKFKIVGEYLNKDETMAQIAIEINAYCEIYNIPSIFLNDNEWDNFFNILYNFFLEKGLETEFYNLTSELVRYTFAKVLINKSTSIDLSDFIGNLYYLQNSQINKREILNLQKEIKAKIQDAKITNFTDFVNDNSRKK